MKRIILLAVFVSPLAANGVAVWAGNPNLNNPAPGQSIASQPGTPPNMAAQPGISGQGGAAAAVPGQPGLPAGNNQFGRGPMSGAPQMGAIPEFAKGLKFHGRCDGGAIAPATAKGIGISLIAGKDCKPMERSLDLCGYLFHFCRLKDKVVPCMPCFPPMMGEVRFLPGPPAPFGDLELTGVGMVSDATPDAGPTYRITMLNNSPLPSRDFHVSLIASLGDLADGSLLVTVPVKEVAANAVGTIDVQLPVAAMTLGNPAQPFDSLIVVVDSYDELAETNEMNNIAIVGRSEVVSITMTEAVPAEAPAAAPAGEAPVVTAPAAAAPAPANAPEQVQVVPDNGSGTAAAPAAPAVPSNANLNLDNVAGAGQLLGG